jgi:hypothetical protein
MLLRSRYPSTVAFSIQHSMSPTFVGNLTAANIIVTGAHAPRERTWRSGFIWSDASIVSANPCSI